MEARQELSAIPLGTAEIGFEVLVSATYGKRTRTYAHPFVSRKEVNAYLGEITRGFSELGYQSKPITQPSAVINGREIYAQEWSFVWEGGEQPPLIVNNWDMGVTAIEIEVQEYSAHAERG